MNNKQLSQRIGNIDEKFILETEDMFECADVYSSGEHSYKRFTMRRIAVLAAILCLLATMAATVFAANLFGLRDWIMSGKSEGYVSDMITISGYNSTPEGMATAEWLAFRDSYDPDGTIIAEIGNKPTGLSERYDNYSVYTQEMADKLDEIAAKYKLALHTDLRAVMPYELVDIVGDFIVNDQNILYSGFIFENGSFHFDGDYVLSSDILVSYQFDREVKGTLSEVALNIGNIDDYREWTYETFSGQVVTLATSPYKSLMLLECKDCFIIANVLSGEMERADLERFADSFNYNLLSPVEKPDFQILEGSADNGEIVISNCNEAFVKVLEDLLYDNKLPDGTECEAFQSIDINKFAFWDVNGDGNQELILKFTNSYVSNMAAYVLAYDEKTGVLKTELKEFPVLKFYDNGFAMASWSHNQGMAGESFWPYNLYSYDSKAKSYKLIAMVDAWDKNLAAEYNGNSFPSEIDRSNTGIVYYIMTDGVYDIGNPVDAEDYELWLKTMLKGASEMGIPYLELTEENLSNVRKGMYS